MKRFSLILGSLVGLAAILFGIALAGGALMNPEHRAERSVILSVPTDSIYQLITDFANSAMWRKELLKVEMLPPAEGKLRWIEFSRDNSSWTFEAVRLDPPRRIVIRIAEPDAPVEGSWTISLKPVEEGCAITIIEEGRINNLIFRFIGRLFFSQTESIDAYLKSLAAHYQAAISFDD